MLCGYGVRPLHTVAFSFALILAFGLIFWRQTLVGSLAPGRHPGIRRSGTNSLEESMYFSIMMFLTRQPYSLHPAGRGRYLIIIEYLSGWLLMALFLVTPGRLMIR